MRLGHYKCTTGKRCSSTNWFFMCRVTQISSTVRDKSAAVSPALIQAPAAEKGGKGLLIDQHHVMRFVFGIRAGFWGSLTHGNISSWKRQYLWCRRRLTNGSVEWVSWSGSQARGGGGIVWEGDLSESPSSTALTSPWELPFVRQRLHTESCEQSILSLQHPAVKREHNAVYPTPCCVRALACVLQADSVPLWKGKETLHHL